MLKPTSLTNVQFKDFDLNTGDDRTCGELNLRWDTDQGLLTFCLVYDTALEPSEEVWTLAGESQLESEEHEELWQGLSDLVLQEVQPPHFYSGPKAEALWRKDFAGVDLAPLLRKLQTA